MISDDGAADIVAKELGVRTLPEFQDEELSLTIADLVPGMSNITVVGRIANVTPIKEFTDKMGNKSFVCNAKISDKSGDIRLVLWGDMTNLVRDSKIKIGIIIRINGGYVKEGLGGGAELHVGKKGQIEIEPKGIVRNDFQDVRNKPKTVAELKTDLTETDFAGIIRKISPSTVTRTGSGREVIVSSVIVEDAYKATVRIVFWNEKTAIIENARIGDTVEVSSGRVRHSSNGEIEIHIGSNSTAKIVLSKSETALTETLRAKGIGELRLGVQSVPIKGFVVGRPFFRQFTRNDGTNGKILSFTLSDGTSTVRAIAWGETAEELTTLRDGDTIIIKESNLKRGIRGEPELHVKCLEMPKPLANESATSQAEHYRNECEHGRASTVLRKEVYQLLDGDTVEIRGMITRVQNRSPVYRACPKCLRKVEQKEGKWLCPNDGVVTDPEMRALYSLVLDDGTGTITCVLSGSLGEELIGIKGSELSQVVNSGIEDSNAILSILLGLEIIFLGKCAFNPRQRRNEFRVSRFAKPDPREEAKILLEHIRNDLAA
jgi:replication factor A1